MNSRKRILSAAFVALTPVLSCISLHAQATNVLFGRTTVTFDPSFLSSVQGAGVTIALLDGSALSNGAANFTAVTGILDPQSLAGEVTHSGGYLINIGGNVVRLQNFTVDTTNTGKPVITAMLIVNGSVMGRIPAFSELAGSDFSVVKQAGSAQITGVNLYLTSTLATDLNNLLGQQALAAGMFIGTDTQSVFFSSLPNGSY